MRTFQFTRLAEKDLDGIWEYIVRHDGIGRATHVIDHIEADAQKLAEMPGMGHRHKDIRGKNHRVWSVFSYLIVYRVHGRQVIISRVIHGRRNLRRIFR